MGQIKISKNMNTVKIIAFLMFLSINRIFSTNIKALLELKARKQAYLCSEPQSPTELLLTDANISREGLNSSSSSNPSSLSPKQNLQAFKRKLDLFVLEVLTNSESTEAAIYNATKKYIELLEQITFDKKDSVQYKAAMELFSKRINFLHIKMLEDINKTSIPGLLIHYYSNKKSKGRAVAKQTLLEKIDNLVKQNIQN